MSQWSALVGPATVNAPIRPVSQSTAMASSVKMGTSRPPTATRRDGCFWRSATSVSRAFSGTPRLEPTGGRRQTQAGLQIVDLGSGLAETLQGQGAGQRAAAVEMVEPQQERCLVAAFRMEESPRHLGHGRNVAGRQCVVQHASGTRAELEFIDFAAFAWDLADHPLGLGLEAAVNGRRLVGLEKEVSGPSRMASRQRTASP